MGHSFRTAALLPPPPCFLQGKNLPAPDKCLLKKYNKVLKILKMYCFKTVPMYMWRKNRTI